MKVIHQEADGLAWGAVYEEEQMKISTLAYSLDERGSDMASHRGRHKDDRINDTLNEETTAQLTWVRGGKNEL